MMSKSKFSLKVHHRDKKGKLVKVDPYRLYVINGAQYYERPVGSGNLFAGNGDPVGRMVNGKVDKAAAHVEWVPPVTQDQKLKADLIRTAQENEKLKAELEAIQKEKAPAAAKQVAQAKPQAKPQAIQASKAGESASKGAM